MYNVWEGWGKRQHCGTWQHGWNILAFKVNSQYRMQVTRSPCQAELLPKSTCPQLGRTPHLPSTPLYLSLQPYPRQAWSKREHSFANFGAFMAQLANVSFSLVTMVTMLGSTLPAMGEQWTVQWCHVCLVLPPEECCIVLQLSSRAVLNFLEGALQGGNREHNDLVFSLCLVGLPQFL